MTRDEIITTDHPLPAALEGTLRSLLDTLIPASPDGRMPAAGTIDFGAHLRRSGSEVTGRVRATLELLLELQEDFAMLPPPRRVEAVRALDAADPAGFAHLLSRVYVAYYEDDRVLEGLGLEPRPPFPKGHVIEQGDLSLLDPVRARAPFYRRP